MKKNAEQIVQEIIDFILKNNECKGKYFNQYVVGLTDNPELVLMNNNVFNKNTCWIYKLAKNQSEAKKALRLLINANMLGNIEEIEYKNCCYVYCYLQLK